MLTQTLKVTVEVEDVEVDQAGEEEDAVAGLSNNKEKNIDKVEVEMHLISLVSSVISLDITRPTVPINI